MKPPNARALLALLALIVGATTLAGNAKADIASVAWLAGHWCGDNHGQYNEEVWLAPRGGSMVGMHRDTIQLDKHSKFAGFEYFRIVEDGAGLVYWTQPGGKPAIAFRAAKAGDKTIDFLNATHDFPKRIRYQRLDTNTLLARIDDGTDKGKSMEWRWHLDCR